MLWVLNKKTRKERKEAKTRPHRQTDRHKEAEGFKIVKTDLWGFVALRINAREIEYFAH